MTLVGLVFLFLMLWSEMHLVFQAGGAEAELTSSNFVEFVKNLLKNPEEREHFFQVSFVAVLVPYYNPSEH